MDSVTKAMEQKWIAKMILKDLKVGGVLTEGFFRSDNSLDVQKAMDKSLDMFQFAISCVSRGFFSICYIFIYLPLLVIHLLIMRRCVKDYAARMAGASSFWGKAPSAVVAVNMFQLGIRIVKRGWHQP